MTAFKTTRARDAESRTTGSELGNDYLTDGVRLYRFLEQIDSGPELTAVLEDCHSLEVILVSLEELLHRSRVRSVTPAGDSPTPGGRPAGS